jgi:tetratricopeptide (TPR) repeat protein
MSRLALTFVLASSVLLAQVSRTAPGDLPRQAKSIAEFDLYLDFEQAGDAEAQHQAALRFEQAYPQSELLAYVYQSELDYARARNLYDAVIAAGQKALTIAPDNIPILLALAEVIPNGPVDSQWLDRSEKYATRALDLSESRHVSTQLSMDDCDALRRQVRSRAHAALGLVAVKRGAVLLAIHEMETAVSENPYADGVQLYRLAKLYGASGRPADATALLQKALLIGPPELSSLAAAELSGERQKR